MKEKCRKQRNITKDFDIAETNILKRYSGLIHSIKDFLELQKVKVQILLNFDRNHMKLFGTGEELPKDSGKTISIQYL